MAGNFDQSANFNFLKSPVLRRDFFLFFKNTSITQYFFANDFSLTFTSKRNF